jgi:hypothetical protein
MQKTISSTTQANTLMCPKNQATPDINGSIDLSNDAKIIKTSPSESYQNILWSWCIKETSHWTGAALDYCETVSELERQGHSISPMCYYKIQDGIVSIRDEVGFLKGPEFQRKMLYLGFLQETVRLFCPNLTIDLLVFCGDRGFDSSVPVFAFQKTANQKCILLPDPDFLRDGFYYLHDQLTDNKEYEQKTTTAIFVGSTSGFPVTVKTIKSLAHPRVRAATFFRNSEYAEFFIPIIVQNDSEEVRTLLLEMGFGSGQHIPWKVQFNRKFIVSMDGNGATCSRIAIALRSNSVLLKYNSESVLYYFSTLVPYLHYIPIACEQDIVDIVRSERATPGLFQFVTQEAKKFAQTFLTRYRAMQYTACVLERYASAFSSHMANRKDLRFTQPLSDEANFGRLIVHISGIGDVAYTANSIAGEIGSGRMIEGFAIDPGVAFGLDDVLYQVVGYDGALSAWEECGGYCGTRGRSNPIRGFRVRLRNALSTRYSISYTGFFVGGITIGPMACGEICMHEKSAGLEGLLIMFKASAP